MTIGQRIRSLRLAAGLTVSECSRRAGKRSCASWLQWEACRREPKLRQAGLIAAVLCVPIDDLLPACLRPVSVDPRWVRWFATRAPGMRQGIPFDVELLLARGGFPSGCNAERMRWRLKMMNEAGWLIYCGRGLWRLAESRCRPPQLPK